VVSDVRISLVTGADQGLGRAVVAGLARAWGGQGTVYLTGRDRQRVEEAAAVPARDGLHVVPEVCDVRDDEAVHGLARRIADRHGGVDFVDSNATAAITPGVPFAEQVDDLINTNNLGATRMIRSFGPPRRPARGHRQRLRHACEPSGPSAPSLRHRDDEPGRPRPDNARLRRCCPLRRCRRAGLA